MKKLNNKEIFQKQFELFNNGKLKLVLTQKAINCIMSIVNKNGQIICLEGSVRSGKTVNACIGFMLYVYFSNENFFIASGKTIATLFANCISGDFGILELFSNMVKYKNTSSGKKALFIRGYDGNMKTVYCFGANDERSYQALRGLTAGGWFADEINMQPRSFVEEAMRRTIVSKDRKMVWTLNPDTPYHWIYVDYLDLYVKNALKGFYLWFFALDDNPAISDERKQQLKSQYHGIFYRRYILGERCIAEGAIYDMFDNKNIYEEENIETLDTRFFNRYIAIDYGTTNPCVFLEILDNGQITYIHREYYWDSKRQMRQKTDEEYVDDLQRFIDNQKYNNLSQPEILIDPSAESFSVAIKKRGIFVTEAENEVENGIRRVGTLLGNKTLLINSKCINTIQEMQGYAWNDKKATEHGVEEPIKQHDHTCDAIRYFVNTRIQSWRVGEH